MKYQGLVNRETRFTSKCPANEIISKIEEAATPLGFDVKKNNYKVIKMLFLFMSKLIYFVRCNANPPVCFAL